MKAANHSRLPLADIYTASPQLHSNLMIGSLQLLIWLTLRSSAWQNYITSIDSTLSSHFCLAELNQAHYRNPALRRLLIMGYLICPSIVGCILGCGLWSIGRLNLAVVTGFALGIGIGLSFGTVISVAVGIAVVAVTGITFALIWSISDPLMIDMVLGLHFSIVFGVTSAVTIHITSNISGQHLRISLGNQAGSFVIGFIVSIIISVLFIGGTTVAIRRWEEGIWGVGWVVSGIPSIFVGLAAGWRTLDWQRGCTVGLTLFVLILLAFGDVGRAYGLNPGGYVLLKSNSIVDTAIYIALFLLSYVVVERLTGRWVGTIAGAIGSLSVYLIIHLFINMYALWPNLYLGSALSVFGLTMRWWWSILIYPVEAAWNTLCYRIDEHRIDQKKTILRWHSVFWHELQWLPLYGLNDHLVLIYERNPVEGQVALEYVRESRQSWAAQAAQIELDARYLEQCSSIAAIAGVHIGISAGELGGPASSLLRSFNAISQDVAATLKQVSNFNQRLVLGEVEDRLNGLLRELTRSDERYAQRFSSVVTHWRQLVMEHQNKLSELSDILQEIPNPYVVGVPLTRKQGIFVGRVAISTRIEELLRDQDHPPLLLYGQRRMGKTSLLYHLRWLLPRRIVPLVVDLQGPVALANDHVGFLYNLAKGMYVSAQQQDLHLHPPTREQLAVDPFTIFDDWLDEVETELMRQGRSTILLALDEFEALDIALTEGRLHETAVLGMLRHIIQHRASFKMLLAGSHTLDEFRRWASYLINAQMIHLGYLHKDEVCQLIERPVDNFSLSYEADANQRVLALTRGHPYLVQLLCSEIVILKNEQNPNIRHRVTLSDVETATHEMLIRGRQFFADIELNQIDETGLFLLRFLARQGEGRGCSREALSCQIADPVELESSLDLVTRRELVEKIDGEYRFQVEVIRRWFAQ